MSKNIVIFSDGTGQDGGIRPEQRMSNIYKMYRAARSGPDTDIDPREQVAFYDPGLGTETSAVGWVSIQRSFSKLISAATGRGITTNIADCYEFIINHYTPGDRIWIFGFSRGAYTARCIANVLMLCGVPTKVPEGDLPRLRLRIREIADRAVIRVYEHGAGHPRGKFENQRNELARRFREDFGSDKEGEANAAPYFIGVFDTVASLGAKGLLRVGLIAGSILAISGLGALVALMFHTALDAPWGWATVISCVIFALIASWGYLRTALKMMWPPLPGHKWPSWHLAQWSGKNFDRLLSKSVKYARHAISIDENRSDFPRLPWGGGSGVKMPKPVEGEIEPFVQLWFAGNHSDIGGSYPEPESRLSDIALDWMLSEVGSVPDTLQFDRSKLKVFPSSDGVHHDEVAGMADLIRSRTPWVLRWATRKLGWKTKIRDPITTASLHHSVEERFNLDSVPYQGGYGPYRPPALKLHEKFQGRFTK